MKIKDFLTSEDKWTKGTYARDVAGNAVCPDDKIATSWCLSGALRCCYAPDSEEYQKVVQKLSALVKARFPPAYGNVPTFNDRNNFNAVKELLEAADV